VLLNIFVETVKHFSQDSLMNRKFRRTAFCFNVKVCNLHFKQMAFSGEITMARTQKQTSVIIIVGSCQDANGL